MYLSLLNRAVTAALRRENKTEEANAIVNTWTASSKAVSEPVTINQKKLVDEMAFINKLNQQ